MSIILFILILLILVVVHEFGHFIAAKKAGIRVDEFGVGYPPRLTGWKFGETLYSINLLPFGGFVKIFGEDPDTVSIDGPDRARSFVHKKKIVQVAVLSAGILFNIIFAWLLISAGYMIGLPSSTENSVGPVIDPHLTIVEIVADSPALEAGLKIGDRIESVTTGTDILENPTAEQFSSFVTTHPESELTINVSRGEELTEIQATPREGIVEGQRAIGISMDMIGTLRLPFFSALWEGVKTTGSVLVAIVEGLWSLVHDALVGKSDLSQVSGPVGIAGLVGEASKLGFVYILSFTAFISLNLAVINLIPFPALDGGRILFVIIEAIKGKRISPRVANAFNLVGFAFLITLMFAVTYNDIAKLVG